MRWRLFLGFLLCGSWVTPLSTWGASDRRSSDGRLTIYDTRYYQLHTDLDVSQARQVGLRMTAMVEEYQRRTRGFAGAVRGTLPFYLFRTQEAYLKAGGIVGTAGVYKGDSLMAVAGEQLTRATWNVIQHEGFHQFAHQAIGGQLPIWVNEGLADYFGEAVYTGEGFVGGVAPAFRVRRVQQSIREKKFRPLIQMMELTHGEWNQEISQANYDQAWSMVYFLAHGDGGRYQRPFEQFVLLAGRGQQIQQAWERTFGDPGGFEARWRDYWLNLPDDPTAALYVQASATIYAHLLVRRVAAGQPVPASLAELLEWTMKSVASDSSDAAYAAMVVAEADNPSARRANWTLAQEDKQSQVTGELSDGTRVTARVTPRAGRGSVTVVEVDDFVPILRQTQQLIDAGKGREAGALLRQTMRRLPRSPSVEAARQILQGLR